MDRYDSFVSALFSRHPSVSKAGFSASAYKPGLSGMLRLGSLMGSPSSSLRFVHVAGTNGKGSVCSMIACGLASSGMRVGLYTSPHLVDFRERMKIVRPDGTWEMISKDEVLGFWDRYGADCDSLDLSFFEVTTGMALDWFARQEVDVAVLETGLGGRLDSTNIVVPELSVITSIGLDHCALLGNTLESIAAEKAGIFKSGTPALVWGHAGHTDPVFENAAAKAPCPLFYADEMLPCGEEEFRGLLSSCDLRGECQQINLRTALVALDILGVDPDFRALCHAASRTGFRGRWEVLRQSPLTICDIAHNPPALSVNFSQLESLRVSSSADGLCVVFGIMADKALQDIVPLMPRDAQWFLVTPDTPRALPSDQIARVMVEVSGGGFDSDRIHVRGSVADALGQMERFLTEKTIVYIGGSTYVVSEAIKYYQ